MRLIINTSSLFSGGGVQVALSFIEECRNFDKNEYHVFLCPSVEKQIDKSSYPDNFIFYTIERKGNIINNILYLRKKLSSLEKEIKPDCVFTVFGPSYWTPQSSHLLGYALPHYLYPESPYFNNVSYKERVTFILRKITQILFFKKNSIYFHVETQDAQIRLSHLLNCSEENIFVISNTYSQYFDKFKETENFILPKKDKIGTVRFLILSAFYKHKNVGILNQVIPLIKSRIDVDVQFVTTLPTDVFDKAFSDAAKSHIYNFGFIPSKDCPQLYSECDFIFLPTLLECFSANYPEAMKMNMPIVTSDLSFAHSVCGDAALYIDPLDPEDIACKITELINNINLQKQLIKNGQRRLENFPSANERASKYLEICEYIARTNKI